MSIETFYDQYPNNPYVQTIVEDVKKAEGRSGMSLVVILAVKLAKEGQDGARELIDKLNPSNTMLEIDGKDFQSLPEEDTKNFFANFAAFVFGNAVVSIERALINGEYDHEDFCERYNLGANSLQLARVEVGTKKREKLSQEQLATMYSLVKEDKTFAIFFEERGIQGLPSILRQFIESTRILPVIQEAILPIYKPRANFLVAQQPTPSHTS